MSRLTAFSPSIKWEYEVIFGPASYLLESDNEKDTKSPVTPQSLQSMQSEHHRRHLTQREEREELEDHRHEEEHQNQNENEQEEEIREIPKKEKKYWSFEQKRFAVEKARLIGLTKAAKFLQITMPETYGDLSPSTLQYWIKKDRQYH